MHELMSHKMMMSCVSSQESYSTGEHQASVIHRSDVDPMPRCRVALFDGFANGLVEAGTLAIGRLEAGGHRRAVDVLVRFRLEVSVGQGQQLVLFLLGLSLHVSPLVEVGKQEVEHQSMGSNEVSEGDWIVAWVPDQQLEGVQHHKDELDHLENGQVLLPPEVLLNLWSHGSQHVVSVHGNVYERIQQAEERTVATSIVQIYSLLLHVVYFISLMPNVTF